MAMNEEEDYTLAELEALEHPTQMHLDGLGL